MFNQIVAEREIRSGGSGDFFTGLIDVDQYVTRDESAGDEVLLEFGVEPLEGGAVERIDERVFDLVGLGLGPGSDAAGQGMLAVVVQLC